MPPQFLIRWQDKVPDTEVLKRAGMPSILSKIRKALVADNVSRMSDDCIPRKLFYGELPDGKRKVGGQKKRFKDSLNLYHKDLSINTESSETLAVDRPSWHHAML